MNVEKFANTAIQAVHKNEQITLYISQGQENVFGEIKPIYLAPIVVRAQVQSESISALRHINNINESSKIRRMYLEASPDLPPSALLRQNERGGDLIQRDNGDWYYVTAVLDDYSRGGWVCLETKLQTIEPDFSNQEWYQHG